MSRSRSQAGGVLLAAFCVLGQRFAVVRGATDYSAPGAAFNVDPPGQYGNFPPFPSLRDRSAESLRQAHAAVRPGHRRGPPEPLQGERLRARQQPAEAHRDGARAPRPLDQARQLRGRAHHGSDAARRDVRHRLRDRRGPHAPHGPAPRPGPDRGARRPGINPFARRRSSTLHSLAADRGLPRRAGAGAAGRRAGGPADHHRHRQLPRRHQHVADDARPSRAALDPERRDRGGLAVRRGVRQGRRRRGPALRAALRASGPPRRRARAAQVWNDLREQNDPRRPSRSTASSGSGTRRRTARGTRSSTPPASTHAAATNSAVRQASRQSASNAVLVGQVTLGDRTPVLRGGPAGRLLLSAGPLRGRRARRRDRRSGRQPSRARRPYVELGRGQDYSWSATSSGSDIIDIFVETLCGDDTHYVFKGECREMTTFDAGTIGFTNDPVSFHETVHGPVIGYATVRRQAGRALVRSARRADARSRARSASRTSTRTPSTMPQSFFDVREQDRVHVQLVLRGQGQHRDVLERPLPMRHPQVDMGLPTNGTGKYEWRGFMSQNEHPHGIDAAATA